MTRKEIENARTALIIARKETNSAADTVTALIDRIGYTAAREIVATMIIAKGEWDGRIDNKCREWAFDLTETTEETLFAKYIYYCDEIHPAHMNEICHAMMDAPAPAADPEPEQQPETIEQEPEQEPEPVYLNENVPTSNSIPGVYYLLTAENPSVSYTKHLYTVDDLDSFVYSCQHSRDRIRSAYRVNTATGEKIPFIPETAQERTDRENRAHCQRIAETLEAYANGTMYRCPECGETFELQTTGYDEETDSYTLPCGCTVDTEPEQLGLYDYFEDVLNIEYRIESDRKTLRSVSLMVAFGGPTIYIDTAENAVLLYWWNDRARYSFDSWIGDEINDWAQELWNC